MRRFGLLGAIGALVLGGAVVMAASPSPSPSASPTAHPSATPKPSASPTASPSASTSSKSTGTKIWVANIQPVNVTGRASVHRESNGTGVITLRLTGLVNELPWTVDVDGGTVAIPDELTGIDFMSGNEVDRVGMDTIRVHLTKADMATFIRTQRREGVVIFVSDGTRLSAAQIPK